MESSLERGDKAVDQQREFDVKWTANSMYSASLDTVSLTYPHPISFSYTLARLSTSIYPYLSPPSAFSLLDFRVPSHALSRRPVLDPHSAHRPHLLHGNGSATPHLISPVNAIILSDLSGIRQPLDNHGCSRFLARHDGTSRSSQEGTRGN